MCIPLHLLWKVNIVKDFMWTKLENQTQEGDTVLNKRPQPIHQVHQNHTCNTLHSKPFSGQRGCRDGGSIGQLTIGLKQGCSLTTTTCLFTVMSSLWNLGRPLPNNDLDGLVYFVLFFGLLVKVYSVPCALASRPQTPRAFYVLHSVRPGWFITAYDDEGSPTWLIFQRVLQIKKCLFSLFYDGTWKLLWFGGISWFKFE